MDMRPFHGCTHELPNFSVSFLEELNWLVNTIRAFSRRVQSLVLLERKTQLLITQDPRAVASERRNASPTCH